MYVQALPVKMEQVGKRFFVWGMGAQRSPPEGQGQWPSPTHDSARSHLSVLEPEHPGPQPTVWPRTVLT